MKIKKTKIEGLLIIEPQVFGDERGFFVETYNKRRYQEHGIEPEFVQDNLTKSAKGVLRGLHFQKEPYAQGKLVQVIKGSVLDVAVDIRYNSPTYGQWVSVKLTEKNKKQFWLPVGFAHGFVALEDETIFSYKCTNLYSPESEGTIIWNDPDLNIDWQLEKYGITKPIISERDQKNKPFRSIGKLFKV
ncbi:MAG TPA: dTDP-4-dehydrorhamnose 3,5-epimerase [Candidatus Moranbacteria bacterium]|nr:dTDP-4-dehydrorhamnose 3,5-epimerase [Candidatus Moranbacteria bacterium]